MLSRVKTYFQGSRFHGSRLVRMSSGTYCLVRDLGLVKGGKGLRHHETLLTFSLRGILSRRRARQTESFQGSGGPISDTGTNL
jgi:hypothetical protein